MSFFSGNKSKDLLSKKANFYVEFLGWMEVRGLRGERYTEPVVRILLKRQHKQRPPKLTIQVSKKEIKISQDVEEKKKKIVNVNFPTIPSQDVTYAVQSLRSNGLPDDIVTVIYLGYMARTQRFVHAHVYRFDEPATAAKFVEMINQLTDINDIRIREVERDLAEKGEIEDPRRRFVGLNSSDGMSDPHPSIDSPVDSAASNSSFSDDSPHYGSDEIDPDLQSLSEVKPFDSVTDELQFRLKIGDTPLLLPPKDYDTLHRNHGNVSAAKERKCLNLDIIGGPTRERNGSGESGIDLSSPGSETNKLNEYTTDSLNKQADVPSAPQRLPRNLIYPPPSPNSPLNNKRSSSTRDLDSPRTPRELNGYGSGPNSPGVFHRQNSQEGYNEVGSPGQRRHDGLKKSSSYNNYNGEFGNPVRRNPSYRSDGGQHSPGVIMHGRQTSSSSMYSNNSYKSDGSRGSRGSNEREEVVIYPTVEDTPPADYDRTLGPAEMRRRVLAPNPEYVTREELGRSFPQEALRREFLAVSGAPRGDGYDVRRSQDMGDIYGQRNAVKRVNSLYR